MGHGGDLSCHAQCYAPEVPEGYRSGLGSSMPSVLKTKMLCGHVAGATSSMFTDFTTACSELSAEIVLASIASMTPLRERTVSPPPRVEPAATRRPGEGQGGVHGLELALPQHRPALFSESKVSKISGRLSCSYILSTCHDITDVLSFPYICKSSSICFSIVVKSLWFVQ